jgi:hypothetical protein
MSLEANDQTLDPRTRAHVALWTALRASPAWAALVKPGCQINFTADGSQRDRAKNRRAPADYNEFSITQGAWMMRVGFNSDCVGITQTYVLSAATGVLEIVSLNELVWVTLAALWCHGSGSDLAIPDIVSDVRTRSSTDRVNAPPADGSSGITRAGFASIMQVDVDLYYDKAMLRTVAGF